MLLGKFELKQLQLIIYPNNKNGHFQMRSYYIITIQLQFLQGQHIFFMFCYLFYVNG